MRRICLTSPSACVGHVAAVAAQDTHVGAGMRAVPVRHQHLLVLDTAAAVAARDAPVVGPVCALYLSGIASCLRSLSLHAVEWHRGLAREF